MDEYTITRLPSAPPASSGGDEYTITALPPAANADTKQFAETFRSLVPPMMGGRYLPDLIMGGKQVLDAAAQAAARATGLGVASTEKANQETMDAYNRWAHPENQPGAELARGIGQGVVTAPVLPAIGGGGLLKSVAGGAGTGALGSVSTPVYGAKDDADYWAQKRGQAASGATAGAVMGAGGGLLGKALAPAVGAEQKALQGEGVGLTLGQSLGGIGKSIEDKLTSMPILGDAIQYARRGGVTDFNRAMYGRALAPFGDEGAAVASKADVGNKGVAAVGDYLSSKYEQALSQSVAAPVTQNFRDAIASLATNIPGALRQDFVDILQKNVASKITPAGTITPDIAKQAESELGRLARGYASSSQFDQRELGTAIRQAQQELRDMFADANPSTAPMIQAANNGWATLVQIERASAMLGAKDGIFSPAQLLNAIKAGESTVRKRGFARGEALNEEFAQAADKVLPNKYPDSGTTGRMLANAIPLMALGHPAAAGLSVPYLAGSAAASIPYLPGARQAVEALLTKRPEAMTTLGDLSRGIAPYLGFLGGGAIP